jgi:hypothetical protein
LVAVPITKDVLLLGGEVGTEGGISVTLLLDGSGETIFVLSDGEGIGVKSGMDTERELEIVKVDAWTVLVRVNVVVDLVVVV